MKRSVHSEPDLEANVGTHDDEGVARVISGSDDFVFIGREKVRRSDLMVAFGGELRPGLSAPPSRKFANPTPMGLMAFGITTFVLSLFNAHARHVTADNIIIGQGFALGGLVQLLAGMWEVAVENTFGATALSSYGAFWISYAIIKTQGFGAAKYEDPHALDSALGFYLMSWFMLTFILMLCTIRSTVAFFGLFFTLALTFLLLACYQFTLHVGLQKASGWMGFAAAGFAIYNAFAGLANYENSYIDVSRLTIPMPGSQHAQYTVRNRIRKTLD